MTHTSGLTGMSSCLHCGTLVANISRKCPKCDENPFLVIDINISKTSEVTTPHNALLIASVMISANRDNDKTVGDIKNTLKRSFARSGYELRKVKSNDK